MATNNQINSNFHQIAVVNANGNVTGINASGNITGSYFVGNGSSLTNVVADTANTAATVTTNAQPNITSLGNLTGLTVDGNITASGNVTGSYFIGDGSKLTGLTPALQTYMFANTASDISGYYQMPALGDYVPGAVAIVTTAVGTSETLLAEFATPPSLPGITSIPAGVFQVNFETQRTSGNQNTTYYCYAKIFKRASNGTETQLDTTDNTTVTNSQQIIQQVTAAYNTTIISLLASDRIVVKVYAVASATCNLAFRFDDDTNSFINIPSPPASISTFIPYTGAVGSVNLGTYGITANTTTGNTATFSGAVTAGSFNTEGTVTALGNVNGLNFIADGSLSVAGTSNLGAVGNVTITGGTSGQVLTTNGSNVLSWTTVSGGGGLANGTSNVEIPTANGNINLTVGGTTRITATSAGANITGNLTLTGNVSASRFTSNVATGTAPLVVTSTTRVANLNVANANVSDYVQTGTVFGGNYQVAVLQSGGYSSMYGNAALIANANTGTLFANNFTASSNVSGSRLISTVASGTPPLVVTSTTQVANLRSAVATIADAANAVTFNQATSGSFFIAMSPASILSQTPRANSTFSISIDTATMAVPNLTTTANISVGSAINVKGFVETVAADANTGTSIAPDAITGTIYNYTANANFTFNGFTNPVAGQSMTVIITQDATGSRVMSSTMKFAGGSKTLSTAPGAVDMICVVFNGSFYLASLAKGYV